MTGDGAVFGELNDSSGSSNRHPSKPTRGKISLPRHPHLNWQNCRFGWNAVNIECMARFTFHARVESDKYPRRCFLDPWGSASATGEETYFCQESKTRINRCDDRAVVYEWKSRGVVPFDYDRVASTYMYLPSGKRITVQMAVVTPIQRGAIFGMDFILREKIVVEWSPTTGRGQMMRAGELINVELLDKGNIRPMNPQFNFDPKKFAENFERDNL